MAYGLATEDDDASSLNRPKSGDQSASDYKKLDFDDIRETLSAIDDLNSVNEYAKEVAVKFPKMTENQRNAVAKIFEEKRKEFEK